ncbi:Rad4-domain-containing protein [Trametopsis cervina]|nr:Rad4-domain-containing protein [Trametopsis cervina]
MSSVIDGSFDTDRDSEDDFDWEEVTVPVDPNAEVSTVGLDPQGLQEGPSVAPRGNIEITLQARPKPDDAAKKKAAALAAERIARLNCHKMHTIVLMGNASTRNKWLNDDLLQARLMSLAPLSLQNAFAMIHKSRIPDASRRGHLFETAMTRLTEWWWKSFTVLPTGHIRSRTYEDVQKKAAERAARASADRKGKGRARDYVEDDEDGDEGEVVRSEKSLMKHALMRRGSRDVSAQLFTALCRALGIPARLVVSLQSMPWKANVGKPKPSAKKKPNNKGKQKADEEQESDMEEVDIPSAGGSKSGFPGNGQTMSGSSTPVSDAKGKGKQKAVPVIRLRGSRGRKLGSTSAAVKPKRERTPDPTKSAPVFWTEVFSRADAVWLPVDPVRFIINKPKVFDPSIPFNAPTGTRVENRMVYVVAFEEDGFARDVTPRYAKEYGAKTAKMQQGGKGKQDWWERVMAIVRRPYRLNRDDLEDDELHTKQLTEEMPKTMAGFKNHPLYVLERHLKRDEVVHPRVELGKFRGEPVYPRSSVVTLKTAENWMRQGRKVRAGCQPMKWVKQHAVTVNRKRAIEMAMADRGDGLAVAGDDQGQGFSSEKDVMQGMYAVNQTELYKPDPVVDGKVPKNDFGNIDLYVPSMLPEGAAYVPYKGATKIARQLGMDHAEAVTGFEFRKGRAFPVITGVVVAAENEETLLEAFWAAEQEAEEKRRTKRQEQVIKRWQRLVQGLRIRQRLQAQYSGPDRQQQHEQDITIEVEQEVHQAGGFLNTADDVVQPYTLPRNLHDVPRSPGAPAATNGTNVRDDPSKQPQLHADNGLQIETFDIEDIEDVPQVGESTHRDTARAGGAPRTMRELAEATATAARSDGGTDEDLNIAIRASAPKVEAPMPGTKNGRSTRGRDNLKAANGSRAAPRKGRKRAREEVVSDSEADGNDDHEDEDEEDEEESDFEGKPKGRRKTSGKGNSPAKRARRSKAPPQMQQQQPVPKSDRVLRTRKAA